MGVLQATDVRFVDRTLRRAFAHCRVDPRRIAIGGFSSGAGMALGLGLANGDLFRAVISLSGDGSLPTGAGRQRRGRADAALLTPRVASSFPGTAEPGR